MGYIITISFTIVVIITCFLAYENRKKLSDELLKQIIDEERKKYEKGEIDEWNES